jgi:hypothetical protein
MSRLTGEARRFAVDILRNLDSAESPAARKAFAFLLQRTIRIGSGGDLDSTDELMLAGLRAGSEAAGLLVNVITLMQEDARWKQWLRFALGELQDPQDAAALGAFSADALAERLTTPTRFDSVVADIDLDQARRRVVEPLRAGDGAIRPLGERIGEVLEKEFGPPGSKLPSELRERVKEALEKAGERIGEAVVPPGGKDEEKPQPVRVEFPGGVVVTVPGGVPRPETTAEREKEEGARDVPPPTVYGEELADAAELYDIAVHTLECIETTSYTGLKVITFGIAAAIGLDDEIAYVGDGTARFRDVTVPVRFASRVHNNVSDNEILSDLAELVSPADELVTHLLGSDETVIVNRLPYKGDPSLGQDKLNEAYFPFKLDDFVLFNGRLVLLEDDSEVKKKITQLFELLQELANVASATLSTVAIGGAPPITTLLETISRSDLFRRINELIQKLISSRDRIGMFNIRVTRGQIKAAFEAGPVLAHPPGAAKPSFTYVTDRPEQITNPLLTGLGGRYRIKLRYSRFRPRD